MGKLSWGRDEVDRFIFSCRKCNQYSKLHNNMQGIQDYVFTIGNTEKSVTTLVDTDYNLIEIPHYLLPTGLTRGQLVRITIQPDKEEERRRAQRLKEISKTGASTRMLMEINEHEEDD